MTTWRLRAFAASAAALALLAPGAGAVVPVEVNKAERELRDLLTGPDVSAALQGELKAVVSDAIVLFASSDFDSALEKTSELTRLAPMAPEGWYLHGLVLANLERYDDSLAALERSSELYQRNAVPLLMIGDILSYLERWDEARSAYEKALARDPDLDRARNGLLVVTLRQGQVARREGRTDEAVGYLEEAVALGPEGNTELVVLLADLYVETDRADDAVALLEGRSDPDEAPEALLRTLASALSAAGRFEQAGEIHAIRVQRFGSLASHLDKAAFHTARLDFPAAEAALLEARSQFPDSPLPAFRLGRIYGAQGRYDEAVRLFDAGIANNPSTAERREMERSAALAELRLGRVDAAHRRARFLTSGEEAVTGDFVLLASIEERLGNAGQAAAAYEEVLERNPDNWLALNNLAALLVDTNPSRSLALARKAVELSGGRSSVRDTLGWAYFKAGSVGRAEEVFRALLDEEPDSPSHAYRLGVVLAEKGEVGEAKTMLEKALSLDPDHREAQEALDRLNNG